MGWKLNNNDPELQEMIQRLNYTPVTELNIDIQDQMHIYNWLKELELYRHLYGSLQTKQSQEDISMHIFKRESNGHTLTIQVDQEGLFAELDEDIKKMEELKKKFEEYEKERLEAEENMDDSYEDWRWEYDVQKVYGDETEYCTPDEIIANRNEFKQHVLQLLENDGAKLWEMVQLKKNGTFKKTSKPMICEAINGTYWEDSYGWNTLVMRLVPTSDTVAKVELDTIVLHY
jgi:hypothetical protein